MASPFAALGQALGGDSELAYQQGLNLGARTEEALAQAAERVDKNRAKIALAEQLKAAGVPETLAEASAGGLRAGARLGDVADLILSEQERGFRDDAAGVTGLDFATGNRRAMGFASGPVDRFQRIGNKAVDDRFDAEGPVGLGDALVGTDGGGDAAGIQMLRAFGLLDPTGRVAPENREQAFDVYRSTDRSVDLGGTPGVVTANPFSAQRRVATPAASTGEVAGNAAEIERSKVVGRGTGEAQLNLPQAESRFTNATRQIDGVMAKIDSALSDVDGWVAGPGGAVLGWVPGTPAFDFRKTIDTIKANTGFRELQQMRYDSPTGGALGQVAVQELNFLQETLGSLEQAQSPAQLAANLRDVRESYEAFKKAASRDFAAAQRKALAAPGSGATPTVQPPAEPAQPVEARVTNDAEYDALPPGTVYVGPDGVRRKKP